ncbi:hypothetical protein EV368DRAFT_85238 [Lentinula lateritia]|nr:hypothetical protein EV368DRAFT_85238 [Lentinula lateritia]
MSPSSWLSLSPPVIVLGTPQDLLGTPSSVLLSIGTITRSFLSSVTVPVAPFELQLALSTLQHKSLIPNPPLRPIPTQVLQVAANEYGVCMMSASSTPVTELYQPLAFADSRGELDCTRPNYLESNSFTRYGATAALPLDFPVFNEV